MKSKKLKNKNGITLIALIITIIVLLILAGISIALVVGDNGILNKAVDASEETSKANVQSELEMAISAVVADWNGDRYVNGSSATLKSYMTKARVQANMDTTTYTLSKFIVDKANGVTVVYKGTNYLFTIELTSSGNSAKVTYESSSPSGGETSKEWVQNEDGSITDGEVTLAVGDYINYDAITGATQTSYTSYASKTGHSEEQVFNLTDYAYGWRIFGVEDGKLQIISEDLIGPSTGGYEDTDYNRTYYWLKGRTGYQNALTEIQNICNLYGQGNYAESVRSIIEEDINKLTGYNPETEVYGSGNLWEYGNTVNYFWQGTDYPYYSASNGLTGSLTGNHNVDSYGNSFYWYDFNTESWQSSAYQADATAPTDGNDTSTDNYITTLEADYYWYTGSDYLTDTTSDIYEMLFLNTSTGANNANAGSSDGVWYWLGSRCVNADSYYACFGVCVVGGNGVGGSFLAYSYGYEYYDSIAVRPLVSLQSDIQLTQGEDGSWNISE